ncbi:O-fucosyltransferase 15 [Ancistrocladus abbreviatus]
MSSTNDFSDSDLRTSISLPETGISDTSESGSRQPSISASSSFRDFGFGSASTRLHNLYRSNSSQFDYSFLAFLTGGNSPSKKGKQGVKRKGLRKRYKGLIVLIGLVGLFFVMNWWMLYRLNHTGFGTEIRASMKSSNSSMILKEDLKKIVKLRKPQKTAYGRLLAMAAHALAENKPEPKGLWEEPFDLASSWKPCADQRDWEPNEGKNGYIMVTANGGLNQQRVAVCNAVAVARLLNSTLIVPKFMYSSVWTDLSQFSDIYQEEHFVNYLKPDIRIVKELPEDLQSLDLEAIGSVITDEDIMKEAKPSFYRKYINPILLKNRVVHFIGFGNRLAFDPIPFHLQRLRCRCDFYALQFVPKIQEAGALILQRMRQGLPQPGRLDQYLVGPFAKMYRKNKRDRDVKGARYLALHLRFEIDMVAHSLCEFGGGEEERRELEAYREIHFPALTVLKKTKKLPSPAALRAEGLCPLAPEEAVLMLAALGFNRKTHMYLAGAQIYGGRSRLASLSSLYPNLVTKEDLLSPSEIEPFRNFSSQLAALDFIGCTAASAFAMTDSGSQLSALVSGYRMYYGGGKMPTIRPNKRRLAGIFLKNSTIEWKVFEQRVRKAVRQTKQIHSRPTARSIYRHPRCKECMCLLE